MTQQARPKAFRKMAKDDLLATVLRVARQDADFAGAVWKMATRVDRLVEV